MDSCCHRRFSVFRDMLYFVCGIYAEATGLCSEAQYKPLDLSYLPFNFDVSQTAVIEVPDQKKGVTGLNISYPELEAKLYCSYLPITPASW